MNRRILGVVTFIIATFLIFSFISDFNIFESIIGSLIAGGIFYIFLPKDKKSNWQKMVQMVTFIKKEGGE